MTLTSKIGNIRETYFSIHFIIFEDFPNLLAENCVGEAWEVLKKVPGDGALRCDRIWGRGEMWGATGTRFMAETTVI